MGCPTCVDSPTRLPFFLYDKECANKAMDAQRSWMIEIDSEGIETRQELPDIDLATIEG